jgi:hypothetical protein
MGYLTFSMPREIVLEFQKAGNFQNFVETGTFRGGTCFWAAQHFKRVATIEIDPVVSRQTSSRPDCPKNIDFYIGNSKDIIKEVVESLDGRAIYWLDGHWCNTSEFGKEGECPLMDELNAISHKKNDLIFIDDARAFLGPLPPPHNSESWPRIDEIIVFLKNKFPDNLVTIADDVIYCIPSDLIHVFDNNWRKNYVRRYVPIKPFWVRVSNHLKKKFKFN